ncbi:MAG: hypothetical protein H6Q01_663 [Acidobacteria bacterium]|nr:hypothetical protein [Acidobacteriota bacterium]
MPASSSEPVSAVSPVARPSVSRIAGTSTTIPRNPSTTDGRPARISTSGLRTSRSQRGATSAMNIAAATPSGTANSPAPIVTTSEPQISGPSAKCPSIGYQRVPKSDASGTSPKAGSPSRSRKSEIRATKMIAE